MGVSSLHPEYKAYSGRWELVKKVVKSDVKGFIKDVEADVEITEEMAKTPERYSAIKRGNAQANMRNVRYKDDAQFTNFTARTKNGLVGAIFRKEVIAEMPTEIDYLKLDATGAAVTLNKLAQELVGEVLMTGRYGLFVDYPVTGATPEMGLTREEVDKNNIKARIYKYPAENIINWQVKSFNGVPKLDLVVLKECIPQLGEDGFTWIELTRYRVLRMIDGVYTQQIYDNDEKFVEAFQPRDKAGSLLYEIPFVFIGSEDNDACVDPSPLFDIAMLNIGHLRNSADYEESIHICGQPTLFITTEMSVDQFAEANPNGIFIGARRGHNLGANSSANFLQADPNQLADVAMKRKEEQAVMIGARLIMTGAQNETAEAARMRMTGETCQLAIIALNVQQALIDASLFVLRFMRVGEVKKDEITITINTDFFEQNIDAPMLMAQLQLYNNRIIAKTDLRRLLRENGDIPPNRTDNDIDAEVEDEIDMGDPFSTTGDPNPQPPAQNVSDSGD